MKPSTIGDQSRLAPLEQALYPGAPRLFVVLLGIVLLAIPLFEQMGIQLANFSSYMESIGFDGMNMAGLSGIFVLYLCTKPTPIQLSRLILLALLIEAYLYSSRPDGLSVLGRLNLIGLGPAVAGVIGLSSLALRGQGPGRNRALGLLAVSGIFMLYGTVSALFLGLLSNLTPEVFDAYIFRIESAYGTPIPVLVARHLEAHPSQGQLVMAVYLRLTLFVALGLYLTLNHPKKTTNNLIQAFLLSLFLCFPLYLILPMVGIDDFLGIPPWPLGDLPQDFVVKWLPAPIWLPRTCVPSLHAAWAYLFFFAVYRISRPVAIGAATVVLLTLAGTMHTTVGHYFIDIVISVPLAVAVQAITTFPTQSNMRLRLKIASLGLLFTIASCLLLRLAPDGVFHNLGYFWVAQALAVLTFIAAEYNLGRQTLYDLGSTQSN